LIQLKKQFQSEFSNLSPPSFSAFRSETLFRLLEVKGGKGSKKIKIKKRGKKKKKIFFAVRQLTHFSYICAMKCKYCGELLKHPRAKQVYCSHSCRQMAYINRKLSPKEAISDTLPTKEVFSIQKIEDFLDKVYYVANKLNALERHGNYVAYELLNTKIDNFRISLPSIDGNEI
jgi:hypothetical protein